MSRQKVVVIMGGPSREHEISLKSGEAMLAGLDNQKYEPLSILITKNGEWLWDDQGEAYTATQALQAIKEMHAIVLLGLHGSFGEDGTIQALLELYDIPYTGSGVAASLLAMDKNTSNLIFQAHDLLVPQSVVFGENTPAVVAQIIAEMSFPLVVKPARQGSSVGVHIVKSAQDLQPAIDDAFSHDQQILAQEFIKGREVSCGVLQKDGELTALPPTEVIPVVSEFFDYKAKYTVGGSKEITPAELPDQTIAAIQHIAITAHQALGCSTYSRTDVIVTDAGLYVIETNTLPGFTATSFVPQQAQAAGISQAELLDYIIAGAQKGV